MKKVIALILVALLCCSMFAACGNGTPATQDPAPAPDNSTTADPAAPADPEPAESESPWYEGEEITFLIPHSVGSGSDVTARIITDFFAEKTGCKVVLENDGTAGGAKLAVKLAQAEPDGTTIMFYPEGSLASYYEGLWPNHPFDTSKYITFGGHPQPDPTGGHLVLTQPDAPYSTMTELVEYAKAHPGEVTVGVVAGKAGEFKTRVLLEYLGITDDVRYVSAGRDDVRTGLLGGNINVSLLDESDGIGYMGDGGLKALCITRADRLYTEYGTYTDEQIALLDATEIFPDFIPEGDVEKVVVQIWQYFMVPAGTPQAVIDTLEELMTTIQSHEEYNERVLAAGKTNQYPWWGADELAEHQAIFDAQLKSIYE